MERRWDSNQDCSITYPRKACGIQLLLGDSNEKLTCIRRSSSGPTLHPFARAMLGSTSVFHGNLPHRRCASSRPRSSPGTQTDNPPDLAIEGSATNMVEFARRGAVSLKSIVQASDFCSRPRGIRTVMNPPPPIPALNRKQIGKCERSYMDVHSQKHIDNADTKRRAHRSIDCVSATFEYIDANI